MFALGPLMVPDNIPPADIHNETFHSGTVVICCLNSLRLLFTYMFVYCLQCFDAVGWAAGRASGL